MLRPSIEPFVDRHGVLCFVRPGGEDAVVRNPEPADLALIERLRPGWETPVALADALDVDVTVVRSKLDSLLAAGIVLVRSEDRSLALEGDDAERFARQLPYLAELGHELALQRRLRSSRVTVLGCGGLGTWAIAALACIGVGAIVLVDDDHVSLSNLNRQILYTREQVGASKVDTTARWIRAFDPAIDVTCITRRIRSVADVEEAIEGAQAIVLAADWPPYELGRWVNAASVKHGVPFIVAGQLPPILKVGPTYAPGDGPCFTCHETALRDSSYAYEDYVAFRAAEPADASTIGPASCIAGGFIGLELLHLLTGQRPATCDSSMIVHMSTLDVRREAVDRDPSCEACKHLADDTDRTEPGQGA